MFHKPSVEEYKRLLKNNQVQDYLDQKELNRKVFPVLAEEQAVVEAETTNSLQLAGLKAQRGILSELKNASIRKQKPQPTPPRGKKPSKSKASVKQSLFNDDIDAILNDPYYQQNYQDIRNRDWGVDNLMDALDTSPNIKPDISQPFLEEVKTGKQKLRKRQPRPTDTAEEIASLTRTSKKPQKDKLEFQIKREGLKKPYKVSLQDDPNIIGKTMLKKNKDAFYSAYDSALFGQQGNFGGVNMMKDYILSENNLPYYGINVVDNKDGELSFGSNKDAEKYDSLSRRVNKMNKKELTNMIDKLESTQYSGRGLKIKKMSVQPQKQNDKSRWWTLYKKLGGKGNYKTITTKQMIDYIAQENKKKTTIVKASKQRVTIRWLRIRTN